MAGFPRKLPELQPVPGHVPHETATSVRASLEDRPGPDPRGQQPETNVLHSKRSGLSLKGACEPCKKAKRKCNGERPQCQACRRRGTPAAECVYVQLEGLSRAESLKQALRNVEEECEVLRALLSKVVPLTLQVDLRDYSQTLGENVAFRPLDDEARAALELLVTSNSDKDSHGTSAQSGNPALSLSTATDAPPSPEQRRMNDFVGRHITLWSTDRPSIRPNDRRKRSVQRGSSGKPILLTSDDAAASPATSRHDQEHHASIPEGFLEDVEPMQTSESTASSEIFDWQPSEAEYRMRLSILFGQSDVFTSQEHHAPFKLNTPVSIHTLQPLHFHENISPLFSRSILSFLRLARQRLAEGWALEKILGPIHYDISRLLSEDPGYSVTGYIANYDEFSVPSFAMSVLQTFPDVCLMAKICTSLYCARILRWLIAPTVENYNLAGLLARPTPTQLLVPHFAEYDIIIIPLVRDALIARPREYLQIAGHWHCTWDLNEPFTRQDPVTKSITLTTTFEDFAMSEGCWWAEPEVFDVYPELVGKLNVWPNEGQSGPPNFAARNL